MVLSIKSEEADRLARELAHRTGESITDAVTVALRDRLDRQRRSAADVGARLQAIRVSCRSIPRRDGRTEDEILGYDEHGLPT